MSRTHKDKKDYRQRGAESKRPGRYRPGSRRRRLDLIAREQERANFDVEKFGRAAIRAALRNAEVEHLAMEDSGRSEGDGHV